LNPPYKTQNACGYSPIAIIGVLIVGGTLLLISIGIGFVPFQPGVNIVGSSSAAISAACHPPFGEEIEGKQMSYQKLKWGVVAVREDGIGHCAFSSGEVGPLEVGKKYAGTSHGQVNTR
jgi:hypothetical protein